MRVLFTAPSSKPRLHTQVPLAWALRADGHDVQIAGSVTFAESINRTGLVAVAAGEDSGDDSTAQAAVENLVAHARAWKPDLVIWDDQVPAGDTAARDVGVPSVRILGFFDPLPPADTAITTLDTTIPSMRPDPGNGNLQLRCVPYNGPAAVPAWLRRKPRRERVFLALGEAAISFAEVCDAVGGLDIEVVCAGSPDGLASDTALPDNMRLFDSAPLNATLPLCSAVVHDGATPAVTAALSFGVPQLALTAGPAPVSEELANRGAGLMAEPGRVTAGALADLITRLLHDAALRDSVRRLREEVSAMPSPREVAQKLAALAKR